MMNQEWCPTQGGEFTAYRPQVMYKGDWIDIPLQDVGVNGVPYPLFMGGVARTVGLCGHAQAQCLAWGYAAAMDAESGEMVQVRVQAFKVVYDIKARAIDDPVTATQEDDHAN
jgi:hypothetical protein